MTTVDQVAPLDPVATAPVPVASRLIGALAVGVALLSATATFLVLAGLTPIAPVHEVVVKLLLGNAITGLLLLAIIGREVWVVVQARRRGRAGSRLHVQIVSLFAVIAAVPTVLVAVVASTTLDRGLDRFFSTRTRAMIEQSLIVANAYVTEHAEAIRGEVLAMAYDVGRAKPLFDQDSRSISEIPHRPSQRARSLRRHHHQARRLDRGSRRRHDGQENRAAVRGAAEAGLRNRAAGRADSGRRSRRRRRQAARLRRHVSLRRAPARSASRAAIARNAGERRRICHSRSAPARHSESPSR